MEVGKPKDVVRGGVREQLIGLGCIVGMTVLNKLADSPRSLSVLESICKRPWVARTAVKIGERTNLFTHSSPLFGKYHNLMDMLDRHSDQRKIKVVLKIAASKLNSRQRGRKPDDKRDLL